jgi:hypothetical protein
MIVHERIKIYSPKLSPFIENIYNSELIIPNRQLIQSLSISVMGNIVLEDQQSVLSAK